MDTSGEGFEMKAIILAGGRGRRLGRLTESNPKPLIEVLGKPILEHLIRNASEASVYDYLINIGYLGRMIQDYFEDGSKFGVNINYFESSGRSPEQALFDARSYLDGEIFYCFCGDNILLPWQIQLLQQLYKEKSGLDALFTIDKKDKTNQKRVKVNSYDRITGSSRDYDDGVLAYNMVMRKDFLEELYQATVDKDEKSFALLMDDMAQSHNLRIADIGDFININLPGDIMEAEEKLKQPVAEGKYIVHVFQKCPYDSSNEPHFNTNMHYIVINEKVQIGSSIDLPIKGCTCHWSDCSPKDMCHVIVVEPFTQKRAKELRVHPKNRKAELVRGFFRNLLRRS